MVDVITQAKRARDAANDIRLIESNKKNLFLETLARLLEEHITTILAENRKDLEVSAGLTPAMRRRLELSEKSIAGMIQGVRNVMALPDPVGQIVKTWTRPDGLIIKRVRTPIGVIACIFESRPNVIIDVASLCIKSGNAVIVRGGKEATNSNNAFMAVIAQALAKARLPEYAVQQLEDRRYEAITELVQLEEYLDLVIPRGREELIRAVSAHARVPVIKHMRGLCHAYIDEDADIEKAVKIAVNAKTSNPATCNAIETLLVHQRVAGAVLPRLLDELVKSGVEIRGCSRTCAYHASCKPAREEDWSTEYLDLILSVRVVDSFEEALAHIARYSSGLTDSIVTENKGHADEFLKRVDSATVLVNASNRLTDGGEFGLGGEIGISTARIHMRGPMGLEDLTVTKYVVIGNGHIRE